MNVKIDTNEKFHVIRIGEPELSANMTASLTELMFGFLKMDVKNLIVNGQDIQSLDSAAADVFLLAQETFGAAGASLVLCCLSPAVKKRFGDEARYGLIEIVPSLSEASDMVYMEELGRELDD